MKIKDCPIWPCAGIEPLEYPGIRPQDVRKIHTLHQVEASYANSDWGKLVVGVDGHRYRQLLHKGRKP